MLKKYILVTILILNVSCNKRARHLEQLNIDLTASLNQLKNELDSLHKLPCLEFEKIAHRDVILDSIRDLKNIKYLPHLEYNNNKVEDLDLVKEYYEFSKKHPKTILGLIAFQRIKSIDRQNSMINYNQILGKWKLDSIVGLGLNKDYKTNIDETIKFTRNKRVEFYKNNILTNTFSFDLIPSRLNRTEIIIQNKGRFFIDVKINKTLSLCTFFIDNPIKVYKKME